MKYTSFHSTDCPSEWGQFSLSSTTGTKSSFHSTDCPSEWGPKVGNAIVHLLDAMVSIQLIAPASGA